MGIRGVGAFLLVLVAGVVFAGSAFAGRGNSGNAKLCQKDGWQSLFTVDGGAFASEEACVSYAAQGGRFSTTAYPRSQEACSSLAGTFVTGASSGVLWTCQWTNGGSGDWNAGFLLLSDACFTDGGLAFDGSITGIDSIPGANTSDCRG